MKQAHPSATTLNDLVEGLLEPPDQAGTEEHLRTCDACRREAEALRSLLTRMRTLPPEIRPRRDLFSGIEDRIRANTVVPLPERRWVSFAAAAIVLVALTAAITTWLVERPAVPGSSVIMPAGLSGVAAEYESAIGDLAASLEARRSELDPATVRLVEENLRVIDRAIHESEVALAADPGNEVLRQLVFSGYERKLDLLRRATRTVDL